MSDPLMRLLVALPSAEADAGRAERTKMRCRRQLDRQVRRAAPARSAEARTALAWQPLAVLLGVAYLTEVVVQALRVYVD